MIIPEKYIRRIIVKKAFKINRKVTLPAPENIKKIGVLWISSLPEGFRFLQNHFSNRSISVEDLCIIDEQNSDIPESTRYIGPKELNWLGLPKKESVSPFINTEFDLLFNLALDQNLILDYLTGFSKARFKIGWSTNQKNFFDLNINIGDKKEALYLAEQQIFYLGQLNKTTKL